MDLTDFSEMENASLKALSDLTERAFELDAQIKELDRQKKDLNAKLSEIETKVLAYLEKEELDSFDGKSGKLSVVNRFSVRVPQALEDKKKLFDYLKSKNIFLEMVSVNSMTLNSFYKQEMQYAIEKGDVDFKIPGLSEPNHSRTLSFRRKTK